MNKQLDEEIYRARAGRASVELGMPDSWHVNVFSKPEALQTLLFKDFFEASLCKMEG